MKPYHDLENLPAGLPPLAVVVGVFDGVHRGHQTLLRTATEAAEGAGATPAALTFHPHPASVFSPSRVPPMLATVERRAELLRDHGAGAVVVARFDTAFAARTPEEFVEGVLVEQLRTRVVVVGDDFRYGCRRTGDISTLRAAGERHGFAVHIVPPVLIDGVPARSSVIRGMIAAGAVEQAAQLLGRPHRLEGVVESGRRLGRTIGYPTANLAWSAEILAPALGVYAGRVRVRGHWHRAAISVGTNPTVVDNGARTVEAFVMDDFSEDIYGEVIAIEFLAFLRGEEKFPNLETLIVQMGRDVEETARRVPAP